MSVKIKAKSLKPGDEVVGVGVVEETLISYPQIRVDFESGKTTYFLVEDPLFVTKDGKK